MRHRVLVVGVGSIGERHLRCFQATGRAEVALVEINDALRRTVAERYGVGQAFADLDDALTHLPDVAVIATPAPLHVPLALRLAGAGVHTLIEKPLGVSLDGVDRLREVVRERGVTAAVAYVYRCHPLLAAMRRATQEGRFGRPVELIAVTGQHFPTYRPAYQGTYYPDRVTGGGAIQDALTHVVNAGEWLLGPIDRVVADAAHQVLAGVTVEDTVHLLARHGLTQARSASEGASSSPPRRSGLVSDGPVLASYSLNQYQAPNEMTLTVVCEGGTVRGEFHEHRWRWVARPDEPWHDELIPPPERDTPFLAQANVFLDAVEGQAVVPCSLEEGIQTLRVNLAALASVEHGSWQSIPTQETRHGPPSGARTDHPRIV
jgi:predicted dehydrogenase